MEIPLLGLDVPTWLVLVLTSVVLFYKYSTSKFGQLKELGLPGPKAYPFLGTNLRAMQIGFGPADLENIKKYGKVHGIYFSSRATIVVADTDMLKQIMVSGGCLHA